ncbi:DUF6279 family lipoprotein [Variovorax sp. VNK109]|uniref:DUF6279 family lipoprotein n=1 Tax=Variovorax sp. VNK109 TaxID=3400919 RepID=UPI003C0663E7
MTVVPVNAKPVRRMKTPGGGAFRAMGRIIGLPAFALAAVLGLAGCSAIKLAYSSAPNITYLWIDGYLDLNDTQSPQVKEELSSLHQWHRTVELPRYADLVQRASTMATGEVSAQQVCAFVDEARSRVLALTAHAEPAAATLATSLTPAQLRHLERKYESNNKDYRKEWLDASPKEQKELRYKQVLDRSEMIYGRLDRAQRDAIRREVDASSFDPVVSYAERQRRQRDALATLRQLMDTKPAPAQARAVIRGYMERTLESPDPAYRTYAKKLQQESCVSFAQAHATTTPQQRDTAQKRLRAYERDLREMAAAVD